MLKQKIYQDQIQALKKHDQEKLSILRYILAQIKNQEIEKKSSQSKGGLDLTDDETISVLRKNVKELNESIESFKKGGRQDLVLEYQKQLQVVSSYLPKELSDEELEQEIEKIIVEYNKSLPAGRQNPKALIGIAVGKLKSKADSARIVRMLQSISNL